MNDVTPISTPLQRFSAGEITRRELGHLLGEPISFGETLMMLHEHNLPLPRYGRPFNAEGIEALRKALRQARAEREVEKAAVAAIQNLVQRQAGRDLK